MAEETPPPNQAFVFHVGWVHWKMTYHGTEEHMMEAIDEIQSDAAAEFRGAIVQNSIDALKENGSLSETQETETWEALAAGEWWFTVGGPDLDILYGFDKFKTPHQRWLDAKDLAKDLSNDKSCHSE